MRFRTTLILLLLVIASTLFWTFHTGSQLSDQQYEKQRRLVFPASEYQVPGDPRLRSLNDRCVRIELRHKASAIILSRKAPDNSMPWRITRPLHTLADPEEVATVLRAIEDLQTIRTVNFSKDTPLDLSAYGLQNPERSITIATDENAWTLLLGAQTIDEKAVYAARADHPREILVLPKLILAQVARTPNQLRDKTLLRFNPAELTAMELIAGGDRLFSVRFKKPYWRLTGKIDDEVDVEKLRMIVSALRKTRLAPSDFVTDIPGRATEFGLASPALTFTIVEGERRKSLLFGPPAKNRPGRLYAKRTDDPAIFTVSQSALQPLLLDAEKLRVQTALPFELSTVSGIDIRLPDGAVRLVLRENTWEFAQPPDAQADNERIKDFLSRLETLAVLKRIDDPTAETLAVAGLDQPAASLTISRKGLPPRKLFIGKPSGSGSLRYARRDGGGPVLLISSELLERIRSGYLAFLKRVMLEFQPDEVVAIRIQRPDTAILIAWEEGSWQLRSPVSVPANAGKVKDLLWKLSYIEASDIVARRPKDLRQYGLDNPRIKVTITLAPKGARSGERVLFIGKRKDADSFAMVAGSQTVFLINKRIVDALRAQLATDLICSFNPRLATAIEIIPPAPRRPITLERIEGKWRMTRPRQEKIKQDIARQILDELDSLRADSIAAWNKKSADLDGFGLGAGATIVRITLGEDAARELRLGTVRNDARCVLAADSPLVFRVPAGRLAATLALTRASHTSSPPGE